MASAEAQTAGPRDGRRNFDRYDVGAAAANVLWVPFKAGVCGISAGTGALAFMLTLGAARGWSESALSEGCAEGWLLTGDDFRPMPSSGTADQQASP